MRIIRRPAALQALDRCAEYIAQDNIDAALRFLAAADATFEALAAAPAMGRVSPTINPRLTGLRMWGIDGFRNYFVFYLPLPDGIEVVDVLHGARDIGAILERY